MTRNEARKVIKTHTQTRYSNSVLLLRLRLVDLTYRKDKDNAEARIEATTASLLRAAGVKDRQLAYILDQLSADGVLLGVERGSRHVSCRLNLEPLTKLPAYGETQQAEKKAQAAERSQKAREKRQENRELSQTVRTVGDALKQDTCEFVIKSELLKDVKDAATRRMMMNWDIPRIKRAKANADVLLEKNA
jgi:hypothetical protein